MNRWGSLKPIIALLSTGAFASSAFADNACSTTAIKASANVDVSGSSGFQIESYYAAASGAAIRHIDDHDQVVTVEGPLAWVTRDGKSSAGGDFEKSFALGHQFHALLLHFDAINANIRASENIAFNGENHSAKTGDFPHVGTMHLIDGAADDRPLGLLLEIPESEPIATSFFDWRHVDGTWLPYRIEIDDGMAVFTYNYSEIDIANKSPLWFQNAIAAPALDPIQIYRLHRQIYGAHCLGDAAMLADLSLPETIDVSSGAVNKVTRKAMLDQFTPVFERVDYTIYRDASVPMIDVSEAGDLGWIIAEAEIKGAEKSSAKTFHDNWAWVMMVKKVDGRWLYAGNSAARRPKDKAP